MSGAFPKGVPSGRSRIGRVRPWVAIAVILVAGSAIAAITLTYSSVSSQTLGTKAVPVQFEVGADGGASDYVALTISTNKSFFTATLRGVPEASVVMDNVIQVHNVDSRVHTVTLSTTQNTNSFVTVYKIDFFDATTNVGTFDLKAASPTVTFASLAVNKVLTGKVTITLAAGAGANNVADVASVTTAVSS